MRNSKKMVRWRVIQVFIASLVAVAIVGAFAWATQGRALPVLDPKGLIADQQQLLILITVGLGVFVVIPVFILLFVIAWRYRADNPKATYDPDLEGGKVLELVWWGVPFIIILILAIITVVSTHALDPYKKIESSVPPLKVQVVALQWKWLFIYPDQAIATLNYVNIPENTPIELSITGDAPMNSFWVPALAGQVYAMTGMSTQLSLMADQPGSYRGMSANISGTGYADMTFTVNSMKPTDFNDWAYKSSYSSDTLSWDSYEKIAQPSTKDGEKTYVVTGNDIYDRVIMKYMNSGGSPATNKTTHGSMDMSGMNM